MQDSNGSFHWQKRQQSQASVTGTHIVFRSAEGWLVYYKNDRALAQVLQEMGY